MSKLGQIKAMKKDYDIQQFLDSAYKILHNPIAMFDTDYLLIAHTDVKTDDPLWNELVSTGTFSMETQGFFVSEYFTYEVSNADKVAVLKSDGLKYDRVLANVFNKDRIKVANLVMVESNTSFSADDLVAFSAFADKITDKIRSDEHFTAYGRSYHESLIIKLLDGEITDSKLYAPHVQIIYDGFENWLRLAVISLEKSDRQKDRLAYIRDLFMERSKRFKYAIYSGYIVMIMSTKHNSFSRGKFIGKYGDFLEQNNIYVGVSSCFENLYELRVYYDEAVAALKKSAETGNDRRVFLYNGDDSIA